MTRVVHAACPLCEACCGLSFRVEGNAVTQVRGDRDDPLSRGFMCAKGAALPALHGDPDRLRRPLRRTRAGWEALDWDKALDLAAAGLLAVQEAHGRDALAIYRGNPNAHNLGLLLYAPGLIRTLGTCNLYSPTSMDQLPHMLAALFMYGHQLLMPLPDLDRTQLLLIVGANPAVSNGSAMTAPGVVPRLRAIRRRGGRIIVVDPRRTETARLADRHHFIRPGSDPLLLAALLQVIFSEGLDRPGRLAAFTTGLDRVRAAVAPFAPAQVAEATGIAAETIAALARELAVAERAVVYGRLGTSVQAHGVTCQWLIQVLNLVTGNLDRAGGSLFSSPAIDPLGRLRLSVPGGLGRWRSRVRRLPEFCGELPVAALAEEMTTPGTGQVRGLLTIAGNPALSVPGAPALEQALRGLDFMVSVDLYLNETTRHAHLILPPVSPLEREQYDLVFNILAIRDGAKWSPPVLDPPAGALADWQILSGLHQRLARGWLDRLGARLLGHLGPRRLVGLALRIEALGQRQPLRRGLTIDRLAAAAHGMDLGPLVPRLPGRLRTRDGRIHAAPAAFVEDLRRLEPGLERARHASSGVDLDLWLIGRRDLRSNNSWMHNLPRLMTGPDRCTLLVHPQDAASRGLRDGGRARLRSAQGAIEVPVEVTADLMPGVVSLPHGYGHDPGCDPNHDPGHDPGREDAGMCLSVATRRPGVNANLLTDTGQIDPVGGTAVLTGVPVALDALD